MITKSKTNSELLNEELAETGLSEQLYTQVKRYEIAVHCMDDEIREFLHGGITPCSNHEFLMAYKQLHFKKFGEDFVIN